MVAPPPVSKLLAEHVASALARPLPPEVEEKGAQHILDTVAAMVSGSRLRAGKLALAYARGTRHSDEATVIGADFATNAVQAALANGISAHADETDDSHAPSLTHPGCAIVPAALAMAEREGRSGQDLLRAVVLGYDVGTRVSMALGALDFYYQQHHSSHSFGGIFGAAAAASALAGFDAVRAGHALAYAVQLASGNSCWQRDPDHVEKAFDFGGMPAHNGMLCAAFVAAGFTGSATAFEGTPGLLAAFPRHARPELAVEGLGTTFEILRTAIKKWSVGSPIQAALDSLEAILADGTVSPEKIERIDAHLPKLAAPVVDDRVMPDINLQQQLSLMLIDGTVTFASSHDLARLNDPKMVAKRKTIRIVPRAEDEFVQYPRQAIVEAHLADGTVRRQQTLHVRGTPGNPMTRTEISAKAQDLLQPVIGSDRTRILIDQLLNLTRLARVAELRPNLQSER